MNKTGNASASSSSSTTRRAPLTKAYSCSDTSPLGNCAFITPQQFVELISQDSNALDLPSVPILDCRSHMDFGSERIRSSHNINCRTKIMARKLASKRLEDVEPNLCSTLNSCDQVILYDESTGIPNEEKNQSAPINLVVQAAQKSNKKVHIIQGGLEAVKTEYPHLIERSAEDPVSVLPLPASPAPVDKENFCMTEIVPHVFVGNVCDAQNLERLTHNHITHIVNSTPDLPCFWEGKYEYLRIAVLDSPSQNIRKYFETANEFIDRALQSEGNNVLVHCSAGISRSPTLVLAYMMKKCRLTLDEAFEKMRQLRSIVDPNVSFILQLRDWEKSLLASNETNEEATVNGSCAGTRNTSSVYCGSTSKSKSETKTRSTSDAAISVN